MKQYREWSTVVNPNPKKTVIIPYVSAYGYTKTLAEKIADGVRDSGDIDVRSYDMVEADAAKVNEELLFADGIKTDMGSDARYVPGDSRRKICRSVRKLRMERRGCAEHHGEIKTA